MVQPMGRTRRRRLRRGCNEPVVLLGQRPRRRGTPFRVLLKAPQDQGLNFRRDVNLRILCGKEGRGLREVAKKHLVLPTRKGEVPCQKLVENHTNRVDVAGGFHGLDFAPDLFRAHVRGGEIEAVKATSDIYSVGVILYKLLTGYLPFTGGQNQVLLGHLSKSPPLFAEKNPEVHVPPEVEALVLRCLEKDPKRRPPSARALAEEFHRLVVPPSEPSPSSPARRLHHRRSWLALAGVMTVGVFGVLLLLLIRPPLPREFTVTAEPSSLEVAAGEDAQLVRLQIGGGKPDTKVDVSFPDRPADVETKQVGTFFGELFEFQVTADLNARPTSEPIALNLRVRA